MKVVFFLVHPAHFHLFKNVIRKLSKVGITCSVLIRPKESLESLCVAEKINYIKVSDGQRKLNKISMLVDILKRDFKAYRLIKKIKPDLLIGSSAEITHVGKFLSIPSVITHEDDYDNMKYFSYLSFPFATRILSPIGCRQGRWKAKSDFYNGYHELSYLHPNNYKPNRDILDLIGTSEYFLIRFSNFSAHHDFGISGISDSLAEQLIQILEKKGKVLISSERKLNKNLEKHRIFLPPERIHDILYFAKMFIGDSQSMAMEAAILGVPSLRFNKFAEDYSVTVLDELEHKYGLTFGINFKHPEKLIGKINELLQIENLNETWAMKKEVLMKDKQDTAEYLHNYILNFDLKSARNFKN